ncbi:MAG: hypothetical protein ACMXYK_01265 [Candidatus Woesearchaeota archaeon]
MNSKRLDTVAVSAGFENFPEMAIKLFLPLINLALFAMVAIIIFLPQVPLFVGPAVFLIIALGAISYPVIRYEMIRKDIESHLLSFITYAGTLSTMKITRQLLFQRVAESTNFGFISHIFNKILYIAKKWTLGYSKACRKIGQSSPSRILEDFLDRLAITMDFGEELEFFLQEEQKSVFEDYSVEYNKSLETIKMLQDMFISISISGAFALGILLLAPLMMGISLEGVILYAGIGFILFDVLIMYLVNMFIPYDPIFHEFKTKNKNMRKVLIAFWIAMVLFPILFGSIIYFFHIEFIYAFFIAFLPFAVPGFLAQNEEQNVHQRDKNFIIYIKVLGSSIEVRNGAVIPALHETQIHDFGILNSLSTNVFRRLKLGNDKYRCWELFGLESGSHLIYIYSKIFSESIAMGGNARKIGQIISTNMQSLLSLRKLRLQLKEGLRGAFYGSLVGFVATLFVTAKISEVMVKGFTTQGGTGSTELSSFVNSIVPQVETNFPMVMAILLVVCIVHASFTSIIPKLIDGGSMFASLIDFVVMLTIIVVMYAIIPGAVENMLPNFDSMFIE